MLLPLIWGWRFGVFVLIVVYFRGVIGGWRGVFRSKEAVLGVAFDTKMFQHPLDQRCFSTMLCGDFLREARRVFFAFAAVA